MSELFKRTEVNYGGAMTAEKGIIVPSNGLDGVLMQNFNLQYSQQVSRLYELGNSGMPTRVYYVCGRASGQLGAAHVIGPAVSMLAFYESFSDVCNAGNNACTINLTPNLCGANEELEYMAKFCVLISIGLTVGAQDLVINENSQLMFSGLEVNGTT